MNYCEWKRLSGFFLFFLDVLSLWRHIPWQIHCRMSLHKCSVRLVEHLLDVLYLFPRARGDQWRKTWMPFAAASTWEHLLAQLMFTFKKIFLGIHSRTVHVVIGINILNVALSSMLIIEKNRIVAQALTLLTLSIEPFQEWFNVDVLIQALHKKRSC